MKKVWLILGLVLSFHMLGILAVSGETNSPEPPVVVKEVWCVSVEWYDPEIVDEYEMFVSINDTTWPLEGTVNTDDHSGSIVVGKNHGVKWDFDQVAFYEGTWDSRTTASGRMYNIYGNYGNWEAVKGSCSSTSTKRSDANAILGQ